MFIKQDDGVNKFEIIPRKSADVSAKLDPAMYTLKIVSSWSGNSIYLERNDRYKKGVKINTGVFKEATEHAEFFLNPAAQEVRKELGLMDKIAFIFNGGPGTGKTFLAGQLMELLVKEKNAICLMSKGEPKVNLHDIIDSIRLEDPDRWIGILIDEYEKSRGEDLDMLSFLDGANSRHNVMVIATVNSTKKLPETIINRIGRIERVYNFDTEDAEVIKAMISSVIPEQYKDTIKADEIALEFIEFGIKPSIDFITVLIRNKIYELKTGKQAPELLDGIRKQKDNKKNKNNKKVVGFATANDNRHEKTEAQIDAEEKHEEMIENMQEAILQQFAKAIHSN
jgi:CO dehydrogenase nickel-insertion accessory protein CooC1